MPRICHGPARFEVRGRSSVGVYLNGIADGLGEFAIFAKDRRLEVMVA